jgi:hypothetical protein
MSAKVLEKAMELCRKLGPQEVWLDPVCAYAMGGDATGTPPTGDCSWFAAASCGQSKVDAAGNWYGTDRIYDDAQGAHKRWRQIPAPVPGCIGVYPGKTLLGKRYAGHVWIVVDPKRAVTIECSSTGLGVNSLRRPQWFKPGATGNGLPVIWAEFVGNF